MGIFAKIKDAIFGSKASATPAPLPKSGPTPGTGPMPTAPAAPGKPVSTQPAEPVDVVAVLTAMAAKNPQKLNWRVSIVDLMKLLDLDSSLENRKALAKELGYAGDGNDSAAMNIWLHKQVMKELAANGGKVPAELKD